MNDKLVVNQGTNVTLVIHIIYSYIIINLNELNHYGYI